MARSMRESSNSKRLISNHFVGNEGPMGVSALRATACAGVLVGCLMLGDSAAGLAVADPGGFGHGRRDEGSSKAVNHERASRAATIRRVARERRRRHHHVAQDAPPTTFGSGRESAYAATESDVATFSDATEPAPEPEPAPELAPDTERGADPDVGTEGTEPGGGTDPGGGSDPAPPADTGGDGSDYSDNDTVVSANTVVSPEPAPQKLDPAIEFPVSVLPPRDPPRRRRLVEREPDHFEARASHWLLSARAAGTRAGSRARARAPRRGTRARAGPRFVGWRWRRR